MRTEIWIAVAVYVLSAMFERRLDLTRSLCEFLQIFSLNLLGKSTPDAAHTRCRSVRTAFGQQPADSPLIHFFRFNVGPGLAEL
jgi:hypothetical protein